METPSHPRLITYEFINEDEARNGYLVHTKDLFAVNIIRFYAVSETYSFEKRLAVVFLPEVTMPGKQTSNQNEQYKFRIAHTTSAPEAVNTMIKIAYYWEEWHLRLYGSRK